MNSSALNIISSMATKKLLGTLIEQYERQHPGVQIELESVGGVDAAKRIQHGEKFDGVVLASDAIEKLMDSGHVAQGSSIGLVRSGVALAVPAGSPHPDIGDEAAVKQAVLSARSLGYSTGPSGVQLAALFERWGIAEQIKEKIVVPPPGVPVGSLIAKGEVALGFQQLSELMHMPGIEIMGPLPADIQISTIFSGGVVATSPHAEAVRRLFDFMASSQASEAKRENGMEPV